MGTLPRFCFSPNFYSKAPFNTGGRGTRSLSGAALRRFTKSMHFVSTENFCASTGLSKTQLDDFEAKGLIASVMKGKQRFYSLREVYRVKGILYFMRTAGLTAEEARTRVDAGQN